MAFTTKEWDIVKAFYERGLTLSEITEQQGVVVTDRSSIHRKAKRDGWVKGSKNGLVNKEIVVKQLTAEIKQQKSTMGNVELQIHNDIVDKRSAHIEFFDSAAIENIKRAMALPLESVGEHKILADTISTARESVLGKAPATAIQVNSAPGSVTNLTTLSAEDASRAYQRFIQGN